MRLPCLPGRTPWAEHPRLFLRMLGSSVRSFRGLRGCAKAKKIPSTELMGILGKMFS